MPFRAFPVFSLLLSALLPFSAQKPAHQPTTKPLTIRQVWTMDATYTDRKHGVTFHYPSVWQPATQFGYDPPALSQQADPDNNPIAGFGYAVAGFGSENARGPYARTNLEGFGFVYSAVASPSESDCDFRAASLADTPRVTHVTLGSRSFSVRTTSSAGMSQSASGELYATYAAHTCYLFETNEAAGTVGVMEDVRGLTPSEDRTINSGLHAIVHSVRINLPEAHETGNTRSSTEHTS